MRRCRGDRYCWLWPNSFKRLVNPTNEVVDKSAFILDDTIHAKTGRKIEHMTKVFDHVAGKKGSKLGFKNLTLGFHDGKSLTPLDFTLQVEKPLKKARNRKERFKKQVTPNLRERNVYRNAMLAKLPTV